MRALIALVVCFISMSASAGIGTVSESKGTACNIERNKQRLAGVKGADIESMDTYVTAGCSANITFKDDTKVRVTENSRLIIDDFVFDPKKSDAGKLAMKVGMGTVRYASGQIAKGNPQQVNIQTPTATIAVRGTDFNMTVDEAGQSLVILVPSCKDEKDVKQYELDENRCKVGKISVTNASGTVELDKAFEATYVASANIAPTPPTVLNTIESKINNNLILVKPPEVQRSIAAAGKSKRELEQEELEAEAQRQITNRIEQAKEEKSTVVLPYTYADGAKGCNPQTNICVNWERPDASDIQSKGRGTAFRVTPSEHYAEVKTLGYSSNTSLTIVHNDAPASEVIGDGSFGGNVVYIKQNTGVLRRQPQ